MALAPLLPQIITALATLGGVVLTLIFAGRRDERRLKQTQTFDGQQKQLDRCADLFSDFLSIIEEHRLGWRPFIAADKDPVFRSDSDHYAIRKMLCKISLLAPPVYPAASDLYGAYQNLLEGNRKETYRLTDDEQFNAYSDGSNLIQQDVVRAYASRAETTFKLYLANVPLDSVRESDREAIVQTSVDRRKELIARIKGEIDEEKG